MRTLISLKKDLEFNRGLSSLIEVLKNIAVSQYRTLEHKMKTFEKFSENVEAFFDIIDPRTVRHPFIDPGSRPAGVVAITSDSGLLGGLNMQVITTAVSQFGDTPGQLIVVGERGKMYASEYKVPVTAFPGVNDEERFTQAMQLRDYLISRMLKGSIGPLKIVFPRPVTFTVQKVEVIQVVPFIRSAARTAAPRASKEIIFESKTDECIEYLIYLWLGQKLFEVFGLSRLAEFAARYVHLEESLQKLKEMDVKMKLQYFRVRHEIIDRNMRELFSARLLYTH